MGYYDHFDDSYLSDKEYDREARSMYGEEYEEDGLDLGDDDRSMFADPGDESALRAASENNPRNLPCPTCGGEDLLTPADVARGYQCDGCARRAEGTYMGGDY